MNVIVGSLTHALSLIAFSPFGLILAAGLGIAGGFLIARSWEPA